jgi:hypothetical protein
VDLAIFTAPPTLFFFELYLESIKNENLLPAFYLFRDKTGLALKLSLDYWGLFH